MYQIEHLQMRQAAVPNGGSNMVTNLKNFLKSFQEIVAPRSQAELQSTAVKLTMLTSSELEAFVLNVIAPPRGTKGYGRSQLLLDVAVGCGCLLPRPRCLPALTRLPCVTELLGHTAVDPNRKIQRKVPGDDRQPRPICRSAHQVAALHADA